MRRLSALPDAAVLRDLPTPARSEASWWSIMHCAIGLLALTITNSVLSPPPSLHACVYAHSFVCADTRVSSQERCHQQ